MTETTLIGPRISDAEFFAKIDVARPGLEQLLALVQAGDFAGARRVFAAEVRRTLQPQRFLRIRREWAEPRFMHPNETIETAAERILTGELISCSTPHKFEGEVDWFINPTFNQYKEWTWQLSRHPEWAVLAERYRATGDERYAEAFVRYFCSWVRQALVPENADGGATLCWRTIEAGIRMGGPWQWALHSFYTSPHFTDDVLVDWYKSIWEHGWRLRNFHRTGNWLIMEMNGLAQISVLYPQFLDAPAWKAYAFERMVEELDAQVYPDGWQVELSSGYHQVDIINYQWLIDVLKVYDEPVPPAFYEQLERMHAVNVLCSMPDGRLPDVNDGGWQEVAPLLVSAVEDYPQRADFRWAFTRGKEGQPPEVKSLAFDYAGYYISRSGWEHDALWCFLDAGHFGYGHQHEDKLSVLLHAYGRLLLGEAGNYAYDDSEMRRYVLSTRAHNTVRVDGQDQNRRAGYTREQFDVRQPSDGKLTIGDELDIAEGVYAEGYGPNADRSVTHHRKVLTLKQARGALGPCVVVIDTFDVSDGAAHTYEWLWHFDSEHAVCQHLTARTFEPGQANLTVLPTPLDGLVLGIVCGQEEPWQGWKAIKDHQQGEYEPVAAALYEASVTGSFRQATLLYPTRPHETCPVVSVSLTDDGSVELVLADGQKHKI